MSRIRNQSIERVSGLHPKIDGKKSASPTPLPDLHTSTSQKGKETGNKLCLSFPALQFNSVERRTSKENFVTASILGSKEETQNA